MVGIPSVTSIRAAHLKQDKEPMFNGMTLQTETFLFSVISLFIIVVVVVVSAI